MKNTLENSKLIADFIGTDLLKDLLSDNNGFININIDIYEQCKFHSDWNWLMKVEFKCLEICQNEMLNEWENGFSDSFFSRDINCMYSEVVRFIEWYNNKSLVNPDEVKNNSSNKRDKVLKSIMERYGGLCNLKCAMREDEDVVLVNLCDDLNDEFSEYEVLDEIMDIFK